ncbi:nucleotidyl transferase AbiEii/AbiGii toxin family protein [Patescibacteria group bacterium]|nr:nucleotidyl transferase AbiEii/AbiGii toxin family protein [Patescibacteria group bacterium]
MFPQVLTEKQGELLPLIKKFSSAFGLVGGTAVALQLGHRRSIDFDLFCENNFDNNVIIRKVKRNFPVEFIYMDTDTQLTFLVNQGVKMTFYAYPFKIDYVKNFKDIIKIPDLLTLASMKAFALGRRVKWKDYVDLYFILRKYSLGKIVKRATEVFEGAFNEKLFREQLSYHADINYTEPVVYLPGQAVNDEVVKKELKKIAVS